MQASAPNRGQIDQLKLLSENRSGWDNPDPVLAEFLESLRDGVVVVGADRKLKYLNSNVYRQLEISPGEIYVGQSLHDGLMVLARQDKLGESEDTSPEDAVSERVRTWGGEASQIERRPMPSGRILDIYRTETVTGDMIAIVVDVTESQQSEQELERHRTYMVSLLENTSDGITLIDGDGNFVMFNDRMLELYHVDPDKVYWGIPYEAMVAQFGDLHGLPEAERQKQIQLRREFAFNPEILTARRPLSNGRTLNLNKTVLPGGGCVLTIRDITDDLKREEELIAARHEAEESSRLKSEFVARMSHEMRTPMNGILGCSALLQKTDMDERQRELLDVVSGSGRVLLRLIDDILDLSRMEAESFELVEESLNILAVVRESIGTVRPNAEAEGLDVRLGAHPEQIPPLRGDIVRIKQILLNLLTNSVKFTDEGHVEVSLTANSGPEGITLTISVTDTGVGIPEDKLDQIFERFYQIDGTVTRKHGGAGLGLAITRKLVDLMGGVIQVASMPGVGSTFRVTLTLPPAAQ